ncbi:response regulator [Paraburkholderia sp. BCC1885]|uniref:response regulator n=1 Tax=Paraburkholderia sp. BCC1885 TaxID=2562669 RepID=UPI001183AABD|nr:response regulator [Paraburkholderia sp. BCC1885]
MVMGKDILVLDEDPAMRELVAMWLADAGYDVYHPKVLRSLRIDDPETVGCIVADLNSPRIVAPGMLGQLSARYPSAFIIAVSGYFQQGPGTGAEMAKQLGVAKVLAKPFSCDQLVSAVHELFGGDWLREIPARAPEP